MPVHIIMWHSLTKRDLYQVFLYLHFMQVIAILQTISKISMNFYTLGDENF